MDDKNKNNKNFDDFFDKLNEDIENSKLYRKIMNDKIKSIYDNMISDFGKNKKNCNEKKCECEQNCNRCFDTFDMTSILKGFKDFVDNITPEDIAKPIETLAGVIEAGANTVTDLLNKCGEAIDILNNKYDSYIDDEPENKQDCDEPEMDEDEPDDVFTLAGDNDYSDLCNKVSDKKDNENNVSPFKADLTPEEWDSLKTIIEEEYNKSYPSKDDEVLQLTTERFIELIEKKITDRDFTFVEPDQAVTPNEKTIHLVFEFNLKEIADDSILFNACDAYQEKHKCQSMYINAKGKNDMLTVHVYITI